jgi:hypothetical protein
LTRSSRISISLHHLLRFFYTFQCQDPRDKVYSLLSLARGNEEVPDVDYRKSTLLSRSAAEQDYVDTVCKLAKAMGITARNPLGKFNSPQDGEDLLSEIRNGTTSVAKGYLVLGFEIRVRTRRRSQVNPLCELLYTLSHLLFASVFFPGISDYLLYLRLFFEAFTKFRKTPNGADRYYSKRCTGALQSSCTTLLYVQH